MGVADVTGIDEPADSPRRETMSAEDEDEADVRAAMDEIAASDAEDGEESEEDDT